MLVSKEVPLLKSDSLVKKSSYGQSFKGIMANRSDLEKVPDHLRHTGPSQTLTSYANQFIARTGANQYVQ